MWGHKARAIGKLMEPAHCHPQKGPRNQRSATPQPVSTLSSALPVRPTLASRSNTILINFSSSAHGIGKMIPLKGIRDAVPWPCGQKSCCSLPCWRTAVRAAPGGLRGGGYGRAWGTCRCCPRQCRIEPAKQVHVLVSHSGARVCACRRKQAQDTRQAIGPCAYRVAVSQRQFRCLREALSMRCRLVSSKS